MPDEFDIIFELMLSFFLETIMLLIILIRLDQPRDAPNQPPPVGILDPARKADKSAATTRQPASTDTRPTQ